jgi:hypothetical protein
VRARLPANFSQPRHIVRSHHDDAKVGEAAVKFCGDFQAVQPRQLEVYEYEVGKQLLDSGEGLKSTPGAGNESNIRIILK